MEGLPVDRVDHLDQSLMQVCTVLPRAFPFPRLCRTRFSLLPALDIPCASFPVPPSLCLLPCASFPVPLLERACPY